VTSAVAETLARGGLVVTANNRLARNLRSDFDRQQIASGLKAWRTPRVLPWSGWLKTLWLRARINPTSGNPIRLLSAFQARLAWQTVIERHVDEAGSASASSPAAIANLASRSWALACAWRIEPARLLEAADSPDSESFARWAMAYSVYCRDKAWIDEPSLPSAIARVANTGIPAQDNSVSLVGFRDPTPAERLLVDSLTGSGWAIAWVPLDRVPSPEVRQVIAADPRAELEAAARWARQAKSLCQDSRVAVVVPDLSQRREEVRRIFRDVFDPAWATDKASNVPVNISLGVPLAESGIIHGALLLLRLLSQNVDYREVGQLLRSPYVAGAQTEGPARARFDLRFRDRVGLRVTVDDLLAELERAGLGMAARLRAAVATAGAGTTRAPSAWVPVISSFLDEAGWPGDRVTTSEEHQALRSWHEIFDEFAASDAVSSRIDRSHAMIGVAQLARDKIHQPEAAIDGVQVMGVLEAVGQTFDQLWVCGLTADKWPPPARPDALLPLQLQRDLGVPDSSPERTRQWAEGILDALSHSAPEVFLSSPKADGEEVLDPSPLVEAHPVSPLDALVSYDAPMRGRQLFNERPPMVRRVDVAPAVGPGERISGGTSLIRLQSSCPARAFFQMRLGAEELVIPTPGSDSRIRGLVIHAALGSVFTRIHSNKALASLSIDQRAQLVRAAVESAAAKLFPAKSPVARIIREIEAEICGKLITALLDTEMARPDFQIASAEIDSDGELGGLPLRIRPDRVDQIDATTRLVIDYKTGSVSRGSWLGERPKEPQLPIYALLLDAQAIAFVQLRRSGITWTGVGEEHVRLNGIVVPSALRTPSDAFRNWAELRAAWQRRMLGMVEEIRAGDARLHRYRRELAEGQWAMLTRVFEIPEADELDAQEADE
jgi:probable DNA repair protein